MKSMDIANMLISAYGDRLYLTCRKTGILVYYIQVESLREHATPAFDDAVEAWDCGPVEPGIMGMLEGHGSDRITEPACGTHEDNNAIMGMIDIVAHDYGALASFELSEFSRRNGSAWATAFKPGEHERITGDMIIRSEDFTQKPNIRHTLAGGAAEVDRRFPNALRLLRDS